MEKLLVAMNLARWYLPLNKNLPIWQNRTRIKLQTVNQVWGFLCISPTQKYRYLKFIPPPLLLRKCFLFRLYTLIEWNIWFVSERIRCISCISPFCYPKYPSPIIRKNERITWIAIQPTNLLNFWNMQTYQWFVYVYI